MKTLTQAKRDQARARARASIARRNGPPPELAQFQHHVGRKYPVRIVALVYVLMMIPLIAFLLLSAMRLFAIGEAMHRSTSAGQTILGMDQAPIAGLAVVLGAELAQIVFTVSLSVLAGERRGAKWAFAVGIVLSTLIALVGNAEYALWNKSFSLFRLLETLAPPIVVLVLGEVLALLWLDAVSAGHEAQRLHQDALYAWTEIDRNPEQHPDWAKVFATALRDLLCQVNDCKVDDHTPAEWAAAVNVELSAEDWYSPELHVTTVNKTADPAVPPQERAIHYLHDHPDVFKDLQAQIISQSEVAQTLGISQSSMSRAFQKVLNNGNGHHEE